jgi:GT2 family glycosyltransferase
MTVEVILVDNGTTDGSPKMIAEKFPSVIIIQNSQNMGYAPAMNLALKRSAGRYVSCLSDDAEFLPGSVQTLIAFMEKHPKCGLAGPRVLGAEGQVLTTRHHPNMFISMWTEIIPMKTWFRKNMLLRKLAAFLYPNSSGLTSDYETSAKVSMLDGTPVVIRREALNDVGILDGNMPLGPDDYDWCYRANKEGYEIWYVAESTMIHRTKVKDDPSRLHPMNLFSQLPSVLFYYRKHHSGLKAHLFRISILLLSFKWKRKVRRAHGVNSLQYEAVELAHRVCLHPELFLPEIVGNWAHHYRKFGGSNG